MGDVLTLCSDSIIPIELHRTTSILVLVDRCGSVSSEWELRRKANRESVLSVDSASIVNEEIFPFSANPVSKLQLNGAQFRGHPESDSCHAAECVGGVGTAVLVVAK